jgi:hypothetical protein
LTEALILLTSLQAAQMWALREFGWLGIAHWTAGPALMVVVTLFMLWQVTGTSPLGTGVACVAGCAAQLGAEWLLALRSRKQDRDSSGGSR